MNAKPVWQQTEKEWRETLRRVRRNYMAALRRDEAEEADPVDQGGHA